MLGGRKTLGHVTDITLAVTEFSHPGFQTCLKGGRHAENRCMERIAVGRCGLHGEERAEL